MGDWKNLTIDEKKQLYRHSFRMTLAETVAPHPRWKLGVAWACFVMSAAMLYLSFLKSFSKYPGTLSLISILNHHFALLISSGLANNEIHSEGL